MSDIRKESQMCSYCVNEQHMWKNCYPKHKRKVGNTGVEEEKEIKSSQEKEFGLILSNVSKRYMKPQEKEKWIGDSGATVHITNSDVGMFNVKKCNFDITVGNQETTKCTKMGDIQLKLKNSTGKEVTVTLYNVRYVPSFIGNLFSISTAMSNGANIWFRDKKMEVQKEDAIFEFLPTNMDNSGFLFSIDGVRKISKYEKAFMAQKLDEKNIGEVTKNKKVTFDERVINHTCKTKNNYKENSETEKAKEKLKKKKEKNVNT